MRLLKANEIEVRVGSCKEKGASLLLYKNARVDMQLMDEEYGALNWKREHIIIKDNNYCKVSVWNEKTNQWVSKEDCGTESMTEKQKGEASDSFKRACVNWGIGRELYTSPFIWITDLKTYESKGKWKTNDKFTVKEIVYNDDREIIGLIIINQSNKVVFEQMPKKQTPKIDANMIKSLHTRLTNKGISDVDKKKYLKVKYKLESTKDLDVNQYKEMMEYLAKKPDVKKEENKEESK